MRNLNGMAARQGRVVIVISMRQIDLNAKLMHFDP